MSLACLHSKFSFSREEIALAAFLFIYPSFLLFSSLVFPLWLRYGLHWQAFCVSALVSVSVVAVSPASIRLFFQWFVSSKIRWVFFSSLLWLAIMFVSHDVEGRHLSGILSGLMATLFLPFLAFISMRSRICRFFRPFSLLILMCICAESVFLSLYAWFGFGMNDSFFLSMNEFPRLFMNIRDGGSFALVAIFLGLYGLIDSRSDECSSTSGVPDRAKISSLPVALSLLFSRICLIASFYFVFLTGSRGVLVSTVLAVVVARFCKAMSRNKWVVVQVELFVSMFLGMLLKLLFSLLSPGTSGYAEVLRDTGSGGRLIIWSSWIESFVQDSNSWLFGKGFNFAPTDFLPPGDWPVNPHNLYLQLSIEGGLLGVVFGLWLVHLLIKYVRSINISLEINVVLALFLGGFYCFVAGVLDWPSGAWSASLIFVLLSRYCPGLDLRECDSERINGPGRLLSGMSDSTMVAIGGVVLFFYSTAFVVFIELRQYDLFPFVLGN